MHAKRFVVIIALALVGVFLMAFAAQATAMTWTGGNFGSTQWESYTSSSPGYFGWTGASLSPAHYYPGNNRYYTDTATLGSVTVPSPFVSLGTATTLGGATDSLTIGSSATLTISAAGSLGMQGGILNDHTINISGILSNDAASAITHYSIHGAGSINLTGGTIKSGAGNGSWDFNQAVSGYGTISAPVVNNQTLTASGGTSGTARTLTMSNASFTNNGTVAIQQYNTFDNTSIANYTLGGSVSLQGGTLASTAGRTYTTSSLSGYGSIAAALINNGTLTASGGTSGTARTLTMSNASFTNNGTLAIQQYNTFNNTSTANYTLGGSVSLQGGTLASTAGRTYNASNLSGYGTLTAALNNTGTLTASGGPLNVSGSGQIKGAGNVTVSSGAGLNLQNSNNLQANDFTMGQTATLAVGTSTPLVLKGDFSFQQTDPTKWTYASTNGLGQDLQMMGLGDSMNPQTLEVGGVNGNGMINNFALNSLTIGSGSYVQLVDLFSNAGTAGQEVLYIGALLLGGATDPTFDLNGIIAFVGDTPLQNGDYHGITIVGAAAVPLPPTVFLLGTGLLGLVGLRRWRRS